MARAPRGTCPATLGPAAAHISSSAPTATPVGIKHDMERALDLAWYQVYLPAGAAVTDIDVDVELSCLPDPDCIGMNQ